MTSQTSPAAKTDQPKAKSPAAAETSDSNSAADEARDADYQHLLERLFEKVGEVSSLPFAAVRLIELASNEEASVDELYNEIKTNPAMAARIMRVVNSAYYSRRFTIQDLKQAISLLGFLEVRNLALTVYVSQLFESPVYVGEYSREALWEHLVAVATASRMIAEQCGHAAPEEAYLAGLLHDIGFLLLDQTIHRRFCQVLSLIEENVPTCRVEMRVLTFDHAELGAFVARKWSLPEPVVAAAQFHHKSETYDGPSRTTVDAVVVANFLCSRRGMSSLGVHNVEAPPQAVFERLGIDRDQLTHIWDRLEEELEKSAAVVASH